MTIAWRVTRDAVDAALSGASSLDAAVGAKVRAHLHRAGMRYDTRFAPLPAPDVPSVLIESTAHGAWRATFAAFIVDIDEVGARADGAPPAPPPGANLAAGYAAARLRLEAALKLDLSAGMRFLAAETRAQRPPVEPRYYADGYYEVRFASGYEPNWMQRRRLPSNGAVEQELVDAVAAATQWLAVV